MPQAVAGAEPPCSQASHGEHMAWQMGHGHAMVAAVGVSGQPLLHVAVVTDLRTWPAPAPACQAQRAGAAELHARACTRP